MAEQSAIEWTDATFNAWVGCTELTRACDHCYARSWAKRTGHPELWQGKRRRTTEDYWRQPLKWNAKAAAAGVRTRVFCNSLGDWADAEVPHDWRRDLFALIDETPYLDWLLLTKRHALAERYLPAEPRANIRVGMTVEDEDNARMRLPALAMLGLKGWQTFVSYEPALGPVNWWPWLDPEGIAGGTLHWLICGGESGREARPMHPDWARAARDACARAGVPFFFKQWGEWLPGEANDGCFGPHFLNAYRRCDDHGFAWPRYADRAVENFGTDPDKWSGQITARRVGKKRAGRLLDGREHNEFPAPARAIAA